MNTSKQWRWEVMYVDAKGKYLNYVSNTWFASAKEAREHLKTFTPSIEEDLADLNCREILDIQVVYYVQQSKDE